MILARNPVLELNDRRRFNEDGFLIVPNVLTAGQCDALSCELTALFVQQQAMVRKARGGLRNVLKSSPRARTTANSDPIVSILDRLAGRGFFPVRGLFFDKQPEANWGVPWHQDQAIAVVARIDTPGFGPWSLKDEVVHVQPPTQVLADMIAVRIHLDDCSAENGALRVVPGSHRPGELDEEQIIEWTARSQPMVCEVPRGGVVLMRPLLLHASSPALAPSHRRVLHLEYASVALPNGLKWFEQS